MEYAHLSSEVKVNEFNDPRQNKQSRHQIVYMKALDQAFNHSFKGCFPFTSVMGAFLHFITVEMISQTSLFQQIISEFHHTPKE